MQSIKLGNKFIGRISAKPSIWVTLTPDAMEENDFSARNIILVKSSG